MPKLYVLCGLAGSGKTTWSKQFIKENEEKDIKYISRDEIRFSYLNTNDAYFAHEQEVFGKFVSTIVENLIAGHDIIADATHLNKGSRKKLIQAIDAYITNYTITYIVFETPLNVCIKRNAGRSGRAKVPEDIILRMSKNFEYPTFFDDSDDKRVKSIWLERGE